MREALFAEYADPAALTAAIRTLRELGYRDLEAYTPYGIEEVIVALGKRRSSLPGAVFAGGMIGAAGAYFLQWLLTAHLYPLDVGGRPPHMPLAYAIITFEMGVLFAAFTAFFSVLGRARLFRLYDPVFDVDGFERVSVDRHWLRVDGRDPKFDRDATPQHLGDSGATRVVHQGRREASA